MIVILACLACFIIGGCSGFLISGLCFAASDRNSQYLDRYQYSNGRWTSAAWLVAWQRSTRAVEIPSRVEIKVTAQADRGGATTMTAHGGRPKFVRFVGACYRPTKT